ncbi:MAG TPA: serine/threonine-protein kinase, partial [Pyrinomonadaceae bacterium]|nr:serine/threonine-protein kinase [Pyrinomonadaceae bacterium]
MIAPGTVLQNRYVVERQIGEGGMGAVYIATDQRFGSTVALKETFFDDPNLRKAFEREARLLNHLRHTALPRVSDHFGEEEGQFLVMEYIPGEDLSHMLKARGAPFAVRDVLAWADQLLDALDYLHTQTPSVVHRDIKPQNLKLLPRNQIVLLDFGLAKGTPLQTRVTATGSVFGYSFNYAPIEQMQGAGTDPRSDLYSLGATLYHLLTGSPPADALTRATSLVNGDPDPLRPASELNPRVPVEVADALARALQQSAARRFTSAEEMRGALREAARFVVEETDEDARIAGANALASGAAFASEQETRLMQGEVGALTSPHASRAKGTEAIGPQNAATLVGTQDAGSETAGVVGSDTARVVENETAGVAKDAARISTHAKREDNSVVTRVRVVDNPSA